MTQILDAGWKLESLNIRLQAYGEFEGKHVGKVEFKNRTGEAFMFNLSPEETQKYISLVSEKLVQSASNLGDKLLTSLNLLPESKTLQLTEKQNTNQ